MIPLKNIIFDLHGVLFEYDLSIDSNKFKIIQEGYNILNNCHAKSNCEIYACTNWNNNIVESLKKEFLDIMSIFKNIITPCQSGSKKPDHKIFMYIIEKHNLIPSECILIDDQENNVKSAIEIGMNAIHAKDFNYVINQLKNYLR